MEHTIKTITCKLCGLKALRSNMGNAKYCLMCARKLNRERDILRLRLKRERNREQQNT